MKLSDGLSLNHSDGTVAAFGGIQRQEGQEVPGATTSRSVPILRRVFDAQALTVDVPSGTANFRGAEGRTELNEGVSVSFGQVMQGITQPSCGVRGSEPRIGQAVDMTSFPTCHVPGSVRDGGLYDLPLPMRPQPINTGPNVVHSMGLTRDLGLGSCREVHAGGISKRTRKQPQSRYRVLARSQLRPVLEREQGIGPRRRGRPPGSGNRKQMTPQKTGPNGVKQFHMRSESFTGVYQTPGGRWRAQISHQGRVVQLGMYDDEEASAHRWDLEAIRLRGPTTRLNFPHLKALYMSLIRDAMAEAEDCALDFSTIFDEETIKREIQNRASSTFESIRSALKQEPLDNSPNSPSARMRMVVDAHTIDLCSQAYIDNPLVAAPRDAMNNCAVDMPSTTPLETQDANQARFVPQENSRTAVEEGVEYSRNSVDMRHFSMNFVYPRSELKHERRCYMQTEEEIKQETEKLLHRFQDDLDAPMEHGSL